MNLALQIISFLAYLFVLAIGTVLLGIVVMYFVDVSAGKPMGPRA